MVQLEDVQDTGHLGVVAIITNPDRTRFFIQQKDEHYLPHPLGHSLFGGAALAGEAELDSLARELKEELGEVAEGLLAGGATAVFTRRLMAAGFAMSLFEIVVAPQVLESLADVPVLEGKRGVVLGRDELVAMPLIWGLEELVRAYLDSLHLVG